MEDITSQRDYLGQIAATAKGTVTRPEPNQSEPDESDDNGNDQENED
jgi:hypothetical protein